MELPIRRVAYWVENPCIKSVYGVIAYVLIFKYELYSFFGIFYYNTFVISEMNILNYCEVVGFFNRIIQMYAMKDHVGGLSSDAMEKNKLSFTM